VTHNHPEGIKGAVAMAGAVYWARHLKDKGEILDMVSTVGYDLSKPLKDFEVDKFDVSCQGTIPLCMAVFNETNSFEEAIRIAVMYGGDADTNAAIVGGIAEAYYGEIPMEIQNGIFSRLPEQMSIIVVSFIKEFINIDYQKPNVRLLDDVATQEALGSLFEI
jgi:ADP-ribosyl-[dinitrogen reductase] hydrolase